MTMYRTTFYYKLDDKYSVKHIYAIKHCKRPARTKVFKELETKLNKGEISAYGYIVDDKYNKPIERCHI